MTRGSTAAIPSDASPEEVEERRHREAGRIADAVGDLRAADVVDEIDRAGLAAAVKGRVDPQHGVAARGVVVGHQQHRRPIAVDPVLEDRHRRARRRGRPFGEDQHERHGVDRLHGHAVVEHPQLPGRGRQVVGRGERPLDHQPDVCVQHAARRRQSRTGGGDRTAEEIVELGAGLEGPRRRGHGRHRRDVGERLRRPGGHGLGGERRRRLGCCASCAGRSELGRQQLIGHRRGRPACQQVGHRLRRAQRAARAVVNAAADTQP